jgi:hypothetical protein
LVVVGRLSLVHQIVSLTSVSRHILHIMSDEEYEYDYGSDAEYDYGSGQDDGNDENANDIGIEIENSFYGEKNFVVNLDLSLI